MRNDIDQRIFYWVRHSGIEAASLHPQKGKRYTARLRVLHKSLYHLRHITESPRMRRKHWMLCHEAIGWLTFQAAIDGILKNDAEALRIQEEIFRIADRETQPLSL
jgi:hypothetical protein